MARSQSVFSFFLPNQRRRRIPTPPYAPQAAPVVEGLNNAFAVVDALDVSDEVKENFKKDLTGAFKISAKARPGYEEGRVGPVEVNLIDLVTNPVETVWTTLNKAFTMESPAISVAWEIPESTVWKNGFQKVWVDKGGNQVIPPALQAATLRWAEGAGLRVTRLVAEKSGLRGNPALIYIMSNRLIESYRALSPTPQTQQRIAQLETFAAQAKGVADMIGGELDNIKILSEQIEGALKSGDLKKWNELRGFLDAAYKDMDGLQKAYSKSIDPKVREGVIKEFEYHSSGLIANTPEAQYWRYWNHRNQFYSALNVLRTYRKDHFSGVARVYVWQELTKKLFKEDTWRYYLYPPNLIKKVVEKAVGDRLKPILTQITNLRAAVTKFWSQTAKAWMKKTLQWLGEKLGLKALGALLGSAVPGAGTLLGAMVGAVASFLGDIVIEKLGKASVELLKIVGLALVGAVGFFTLFAIAIVTLISIVLSNKPYPWEATAGEIDCDQAATATSSCVLSKEIVKGIADRWSPSVKPDENHVNECYNDVIAKSKAAGVDPRLAMATWLNESDASNYELYKRLGEPPQDFGIPSQAGNGFTIQITSFLGFVKRSQSAYPACYQGQSQAAGFFRAFCTVGRESFGVGTCPNLTDAGKKCVDKYLKVYGFVNAGGTCN